MVVTTKYTIKMTLLKKEKKEKTKQMANKCSSQQKTVSLNLEVDKHTNYRHGLRRDR